MVKKLYTIEPGQFRCPKCAAVIQWQCGFGRGERGYAYCSRSIYASQQFKKGSRRFFCTWKGRSVRKDNNSIEISYME